MKTISTSLACLLALIIVVPPAFSEGWNVEPLGSLYDFWYGVYDVALSGTIACVATGPTGLRLVDVSDPANPLPLGTCEVPGSVRGVKVVNNYAYVAAYNGGLRIIDISSPANPIEIGSLTLSGYVDNVAVAGNYAYLVGGSGVGFSVVNISNPTHPTLVNSLTPTGDFICLSGDFAYVAGAAGLRIINISDPIHPYQVGFFDSPGYPRNLAVYSTYVYLTEYSPNAVRIVNVSNPALPTQVDTLNLGGQPDGICIAGTYAFIGVWGQGLFALDLSSPVNPTVFGPFGYSGTGKVALSGNQACTSTSYGVQLLDVTNPVLPVVQGQLSTIGIVNDVFVSGSYAYVSLRGRGLRIVDVANPMQPVETGRDTTMDVVKVIVSGNYAYMLTAAPGLFIENVADPSHPTLLASCPMPSAPYDLAVQNNLVLLAINNAGMIIVDVTNPTAPMIVSAYQNPATQNVAVCGNYAYITAVCYRNNMHKVDITDPANPFQVAYYHGTGLWGLCADSDHVYVGCDSDGMRIFNSGLSPLSVYNTPGSAADVSVSGEFTYVADGSGGLRVIDVSDPLAPVETGYYDTKGSVKAVMPVGNLAYVADSYSLIIYDCSDALNELTVTLIPLSPPIVIPANGGSFSFEASVSRNASPPTAFYVWGRDRFPDGSYTGNLLGPVAINPPVGVLVTRQRTQNVPNDWPAGEHYYLGYASPTMAYPAVATDSFSWTKSNFMDGGSFVTEANCYGDPFPGEESPPLSREDRGDFVITSPNPFNPITAISYKLQAASHVSLKIYDTAGRLVATMVNGWTPAGTHCATFNGEGLASGIYLAKLEAGANTSIQKLVLMK